MTPHVCLRLGPDVRLGIPFHNHTLKFAPRWGMVRHSPCLCLLATSPAIGNVEVAHVAKTEHGIVVLPCDDEPVRALVLVRQYRTGAGARRYPGFHVTLDGGVTLLSATGTSGGSGSEHWLLVSADLGWAENIASQFRNVKDAGDQTISRKWRLSEGKWL